LNLSDEVILNQDISIFTGNANKEFAEKICEHLNLPMGQSEVFEFSNENVFVRLLDNIRERDVFIVQPIVSPVNTRLMELMLMIDAAKRASAGRITAVIPYYAYGRSDKKDQPRVPISARLIANFLEVAGANRVLTMDLHAGQIQGFFNIPLDELTAYPLIADYFLSMKLKSPVIVATDAGGAKSAAKMANALKCGLAIIDKRRTDNSESPTASTIIGDVSGKDCIIIDDEILTGGTVKLAVELINAQNPNSIRVACVHPMFNDKGFELIDNLDIDELIVTDTVPINRAHLSNITPTIISTTDLFGEAISRIHTGDSVGALFRR
jgi:ribose-phosphate pyrophosphokinase